MKSGGSNMKQDFTGSKWIWCGVPCVNVINAFMQARRSFDLRSQPRRSEIHITADQSYQLFVNGRFVCRGPARGFQSHWPFDRVDIAPFLRKGRNVVAVLAHSLGVSNFQYIHQGWAGFLCAGKAGSVDLASGSEWKVRRSPGHRPTLARLSAQMGFQEWFDARHDDGSWVNAGFDDREWRDPFCYPAGWLPWPEFDERGIPMLREGQAAPRVLVSSGWGRRVTLHEDVVVTYATGKPAWKCRDTKLKRTRAWAEVPVTATPAVRAQAFCLDFGHEVAGCVRVRASGARGGEIVDIMACEQLENGGPALRDPRTDGNAKGIGSRVVLGKGKTVHTLHALWGLRYLVIVVRDAPQTFALKVGLQTVGYPLESDNRFKTSNPRLNTIFECCVRSLQCCMFDAYVDCPSREQSQWWYDAHLMAKNAFYLSNDTALLARGIRQMAGQQIENGLMYGNVPTCAHNWILPDYTLVWCLSLWDVYWQTGDLGLFREMEPSVQKALDYFDGARGKHGLLLRDHRYLLYLDASSVQKNGHSTLYNLLYLAALQAVTRLYAAAGDKSKADEVRKREKALSRKIRNVLLVREEKRFLSGLDEQGKPYEGDDLHNYAWAILTDIMPSIQDAFARRLLDLCEGDRFMGCPNPGPMHLVFEALKKAGHTTEVLDCIERWWGDMNVDRGVTATIEHWWENRPGGGCGSLCHAWSAHPIVHLLNLTGGMTQTDVAWRRMRFAPVLSFADRARAFVPTPYGPVKSAWKQVEDSFEISLEVPKGITVDIDLPGYSRTRRGPVRHTFDVSARKDSV